MSEYETILCSECEKPAQTRTGRGWYCNEHDPLVVLPRALADAERRLSEYQEMFRKDGEQHAEHVRGLNESHDLRITAYGKRIERLQTRLAAAEELLNRMGGFLDGMYRRPPPIVERLLIDLTALNSAASDTRCPKTEGEG